VVIAPILACARRRPTSDAAFTSGTAQVYLSGKGRIRTSIEIDDESLRAIMDRYGVHTKTEAEMPDGKTTFADCSWGFNLLVFDGATDFDAAARIFR
jgi:hypothetical protein